MGEESFILYLITHDDLDGVGCEILYRRMCALDNMIKTVVVKVANYSNVNDIVSETLDEMMEDKRICLIITDISVNEQVADRIDNVDELEERVLLLDHHETSDWMKKYNWCRIETSSCATKQFYDLIVDDCGMGELTPEELRVIKKYEEFITLVNDYDMWIHKNPLSKKFNDIFGLLGRDEFVERMLMIPRIELSRFEETILSVESDRKQRYLESYLDKVSYYTKNGWDIPYVFAEQYHSELGHYLIDMLGFDYVAIINMQSRKVSLRSKNGYDCSWIAKLYGGGGRPSACGFELDDIIDQVASIVFDIPETDCK